MSSSLSDVLLALAQPHITGKIVLYILASEDDVATFHSMLLVCTALHGSIIANKKVWHRLIERARLLLKDNVERRIISRLLRTSKDPHVTAVKMLRFLHELRK